LAPEQRRIMTLVVGFTVLCLVFVTAVLVFYAVSGGQPRPSGYEPFRIDNALDVGDTIIRSGPVCYADPSDDGTRPFCIDLVDGHLTALRALTVESIGTPTPCAVSSDRATRTLVDCDGQLVDPHELQQFRVLLTASGDDQILSVDLRELLPPGTSAAPIVQEPASTTTPGG
jgi:hypothetical protein